MQAGAPIRFSVALALRRVFTDCFDRMNKAIKRKNPRTESPRGAEDFDLFPGAMSVCRTFDGRSSGHR